jgi:hypothetical protein
MSVLPFTIYFMFTNSFFFLYPFLFCFQIERYGRGKIGPEQVAELVSLSKKISSIGDNSFLDNLYERSKNPDSWLPPKIPADVFKAEHAVIAVDVAEKIAKIANSIVG